MKDFCIILVFDKKFLRKSYITIKQIRGIGRYKGDIVCVISDDLKNRINWLRIDDRVIIKHFPEIDRSKITDDPSKHPVEADKKEIVRVCFPMKAKMIHYHKFYVFHKWFRDNYKKCFYMDTGTQIFKPLDKIINRDCAGKLLAHSDAYPLYEDTLTCQFDREVFPDLYKELDDVYNLNIDHFQSTVMLYDTSIIQDDTFDDLWELANHYVNCKTNDQGILNLYFSCFLDVWEQIPIKDGETYYYDWREREGLTRKDYIMLKYPQT